MSYAMHCKSQGRKSQVRGDDALQLKVAGARVRGGKAGIAGIKRLVGKSVVKELLVVVGQFRDGVMGVTVSFS